MREMLTLTLTIVGKNIFFSKMECVEERGTLY